MTDTILAQSKRVKKDASASQWHQLKDLTIQKVDAFFSTIE